MTPFTCICGKEVPRNESQHDFKCAACGRVYTYQGRFLWKEAAGNDLPGSSDIEPGGVGNRAEDQKPGEEAQVEALEHAFEEGKLPEVPRRKTDAEIEQEATEAEDRAVEKLRSERGKKHR